MKYSNTKSEFPKIYSARNDNDKLHFQSKIDERKDEPNNTISNPETNIQNENMLKNYFSVCSFNNNGHKKKIKNGNEILILPNFRSKNEKPKQSPDNKQNYTKNFQDYFQDSKLNTTKKYRNKIKNNSNFFYYETISSNSEKIELKKSLSPGITNNKVNINQNDNNKKLMLNNFLENQIINNNHKTLSNNHSKKKINSLITEGFLTDNYHNHKYQWGNNENIDNNQTNSNSLQKRSKSHIGNKPVYNIMNVKINIADPINNKVINKRKTTSPFLRGASLYKNNAKIKQMKRNYTAKITKRKGNLMGTLIDSNNTCNNLTKNIQKQRVFSTLNTKRILNKKHNEYEKLIKETNSLYGLSWINKMLEKNSDEQLKMAKNFLHGVPKLTMQNVQEMSKKELKKKLNEIENKNKKKYCEDIFINNNKREKEKKGGKVNEFKNENNDNEEENYDSLPDDVVAQFNKNTKNFFKARKDIKEEPEEEENESKIFY